MHNKIRLDDSCLNHLTNIRLVLRVSPPTYIILRNHIPKILCILLTGSAYAPDATYIATPLLSATEGIELKRIIKCRFVVRLYSRSYSIFRNYWSWDLLTVSLKRSEANSIGLNKLIVLLPFGTHFDNNSPRPPVPCKLAVSRYVLYT